VALALVVLLIGSEVLAPSDAHAAARPNVLFIVLDDLNHWTGYIGRNPQTRTPNIDRLAAEGVGFVGAYDSAPACNPSRAAVMSGLRPFETGVYDNYQDWTAALAVSTTLPAQFLAAGYDVFGAGKIYHSSIYRPGEWTDHFDPEHVKLKRDPSARNDGVGGIKFYPVTNAPEEMPDFLSVSWAIGKLRVRHDRPFFLAVGLEKPHMPWAVPKKYFDRFELDSIKLPPHLDNDLDDVPEAAKAASELRDHKAILRSGRWTEAIRAYLATISFADEQVGRLLDALDESPYRDNTIVVLWGDNGFHLGEKQHWRKFTLWEEGTRVPLVWRAPAVTTPGGLSTRAVDLTSIYPTLCELAGIPVPAQVRAPSLVPLLRSPDSAWEHPALMTLGVGSSAVRMDQWRYIRYPDGSEELYDHSTDPYEWHNLAGRPNLAATKAALANWLPKTYAQPLPTIEENTHWWVPALAATVVLAIAWAVIAMRRRRRRSVATPGSAGGNDGNRA